MDCNDEKRCARGNVRIIHLFHSHFIHPNHQITGRDFLRIELKCPTFSDFKTTETKEAIGLIRRARSLRRKWLYRKKVPDWKRRMSSKIDDLVSMKLTEESKAPKYKMGEDGIMKVEGIEAPYDVDEFHKDYGKLIDIVTNGPVRTLSHKRIELLQKKFEMHKELNGHLEEEWNKSNGLDFYTINKVDTHVHLAAAFSAKRFTEFIKEKFEHNGTDVVDASKNLTLNDVAKEINFNPSRLNVDSIDVTADNTIFNRFDHFNAKYVNEFSKCWRDFFHCIIPSRDSNVIPTTPTQVQSLRKLTTSKVVSEIRELDGRTILC